MKSDQHREENYAFYLFTLLGLLIQTLAVFRLLKDRRNSDSPIAQSRVAQQMPGVVPASAPTQSEAKDVGETNSSDQWSMFRRIMGWASAIITLIGAAIFYVAGWVYEAHWFGFYGIDSSRLALPVTSVMIQGIPGILLLTLCVLITVSIAAIGNRLFYSSEIRVANIPGIIIAIYFFAFGILGGCAIFMTLATKDALPWEAWVFIAPGIIVFSFLFIFIARRDYFDTSFRLQSILATARQHPSKDWGKLWLVGAIEMAKLMPVLNLLSLPRYPAYFEEEILFKEEEIRAQIKNQGAQLIEALKITWPFWISLAMIFLFFISISTSALLGEWDAHHGGRTLVGDWQFPETYVFTENEMDVFQDVAFENTANGYSYGPFAMVASDAQYIYLTDWKPGEYYTRHPDLYIIARAPEIAIHMIQPIPTPTATSVPVPSVTLVSP